MKKQRYEQLDSLRGIAAVSVMIFHIMTVSGLYTTYGAFIFLTPLFLLMSGRAAVIFFFLLSGFVLATMYEGQRAPTYLNFISRRFIRLYIPYISALILSVLMHIVVHQNPFLTKPLVLGHLFMIGIFNTQTMDPVVWSLDQEMRISLIFPLLIYGLHKLKIKRMMWVVSFLACVGIEMHVMNPEANFYVNVYDTLLYSWIFVLGAALADRRDELIAWYRKITFSLKWYLALVTLFIYGWANVLLANDMGLFGYLFSYVLIALAAAYFIIAALGSEGIKKNLLIRPFHFLGRISYSLYLVHFLVFVAVFAWLKNLPLIGNGIITIIVSLLVSALFFRVIESPSIRWSRWIGKYF